MSNIDDKAGRAAVAEVEEEEEETVVGRGRTRANELRRGRQANILGVSVDSSGAQRRSLLG